MSNTSDNRFIVGISGEKVRNGISAALVLLYIFCGYFIPPIIGYIILVALVLLLYWRVPTFKVRRGNGWPVSLALLFGGYLLAGSLWAVAVHTTFATAVLTLVTMVVGLTALSRKRFFNVLYKGILVGSLIQAFGVLLPLISPSLYLSIVSHIPGETYTNAVIFLSVGRSSGFTPQTSYVGYYTTIGIAVIFNELVFKKQTRRSNITYYCLLAFEFVALVLTFKRSGMAVAILVPIVILVLNKKISVKNLVKYGTLVTVLGFILAIYLSDVQEFQMSLDRLMMKDKGVDVTSGRGELAERAIEIFKRSPLLGIGYGGYSVGSAKGTHNVYLQILCEGGLIGLLLYIPWLLSNLWKVVRSILRCRKNLFLLNLSLFIQLYYLIYSAVGNCLTDNFIFLLYVLMAALPYAIETKNVDHDQPGLHPLLAA